MGALLISFLFAVGASGWIYGKLQRTSGNNTRQSLIATGFSGLLIFAVVYSILSLVFK